MSLDSTFVRSVRSAAAAAGEALAAGFRSLRSILAPVLVGLLAVATVAAGAGAQGASPASVAAARDGSHDFDAEIGQWTTHLRRLRHPLSGSTEWVEYEGTSTVRGLLDARANVVELKVQGAPGRIEGLSLRLYEPESHQWTLNFANLADGRLTVPMVGDFRDGIGRFYGLDSLNGRSILVRFVITRQTDSLWRFEQAFSDDGGRTWEVNWIATDTRRA
jgi:hypothetical protein